jgi:hypothetical protein
MPWGLGFMCSMKVKISKSNSTQNVYFIRNQILNVIDVRFQVLTAASMKFRVFWDVAQCSHVEVDDGGSTHL